VGFHGFSQLSGAKGQMGVEAWYWPKATPAQFPTLLYFGDGMDLGLDDWVWG
jgi:hypothetical protein